MRNQGYIHEEPKQEDFVFGSEQVESVVLQESGDWSKFLPVNEYQQSDHGDRMACVTFSALNCLEILVKRKYKYEENWSDRYTSKQSGTTHKGNSMNNVAESIRKEHGLLAEHLWSHNIKDNWDKYYADIPEGLTKTALGVYKEFTIKHEWVKNDKDAFKEALKYAPLQTCLYAYGPKVNGVYQKVSNNPNHCVTLINIKSNGNYIIFDHYLGNEIRELASDYFIGWGKKFTINKINMIKDFLEENEGELIQDSEQSGAFGLIKDGKVLVAEKDRVAELIATYLVKKDGVPTPANIYNKLEKVKF